MSKDYAIGWDFSPLKFDALYSAGNSLLLLSFLTLSLSLSLDARFMLFLLV